jgi:hypothetical protein
MSKKLWFVLVALLVLASLSCKALSGSGGSEAVPGMAGKWQDTETSTIHTIVWQGGQYVVTSCANPGETPFPITYQNWDSSSQTLTWTYHVPSSSYDVTFVTVAVNGDQLETTWSGTAGQGTETLVRVP